MGRSNKGFKPPMSPSAGPLPQADHKIAVDIGGTFTDGILHRADDGAIWLAKALTTPEDPGRGVTSVVESLLQQMRGTGFSPSVVQEVVHATTLVTNAVIERKGGKTALVVTKGTADLMEIRREDRYDLYDLDITFPEPLVPRARRVEVAERLTHDGRVHQALTEAEIARVVARLKKMKVQAVAVVQAFLGAVNCVLVWWLGRKLFGDRVQQASFP